MEDCIDISLETRYLKALKWKKIRFFKPIHHSTTIHFLLFTFYHYNVPPNYLNSDNLIDYIIGISASLIQFDQCNHVFLNVNFSSCATLELNMHHPHNLIEDSLPISFDKIILLATKTDEAFNCRRQRQTAAKIFFSYIEKITGTGE